MTKFHRLLSGFLAIILWLTFSPLVFAQDIVQATSENFTLSGKVSEDEATDILKDLESMRHALLDVHGKPASTKDQMVDIFIIDDPEIFQIMDVDENFVAIYSVSIAGPRILVNGNKLSSNPVHLRQSLRHEYAHHFFAKHNDFAVPLWLGEGLAEYYGGFEELTDGNYRFGVPLSAQEVLATFPLEGWIHPHRVILSIGKWDRATSPKEIWKVKWDYTPNPKSIDLYYMQTWAMVEYLMQKDNGLQLLKQLAEAGIQAKVDQKRVAVTYDSAPKTGFNIDDAAKNAFQTILGQSETDFQTAVRDYAISGSITPKIRKLKAPAAAPNISLRTLSELEAEAVQFRLMAMMAKASSIKAKMNEMKERIALDPNLATSLLVSEAAQDYVKEFNAYAIEKINKARALSPDAKDVNMLAINIMYQQLVFQNFQNAHKLQAILKPELAKYPDDPGLLFMMASSGVKQTDALPIDVHNAIQKIDRLDLARKHPRRAMKLISVYSQREEYQKALDIGLRGLAFSKLASYDEFKMEGLLSELSRFIASQDTE